MATKTILKKDKEKRKKRKNLKIRFSESFIWIPAEIEARNSNIESVSHEAFIFDRNMRLQKNILVKSAVSPKIAIHSSIYFDIYLSDIQIKSSKVRNFDFVHNYRGTHTL
jgi:hypothetical protein